MPTSPVQAGIRAFLELAPFLCEAACRAYVNACEGRQQTYEEAAADLPLRPAPSFELDNAVIGVIALPRLHTMGVAAIIFDA